VGVGVPCRLSHNHPSLLVSAVAIRKIVRIGYCAEAVVDRLFNITCSSHTDKPPPKQPGPLRVAVFPQTPSLSRSFAHHVLDAAAMIGLAAPLAQAGYSITWVQTGILDQPNVWLRPPNWLTLTDHVTLHPGRPIHDFALAMAVPSPPACSQPAFSGFSSKPGTRQPEPQRMWLPLSAYAIPFAGRYNRPQTEGVPRRCDSTYAGACEKQRGHPQRRHRLPYGGAFGLLARKGARHLENGETVATALRPLLAERNFTLNVLDPKSHTPSVFASLSGVIGVHGGAFANVHACLPHTIVIEITGDLMPRTYSNIAVALGMHYFAYVAERFPRSLWSLHSADHMGAVQVDPKQFAQFVAAAIDSVAEGGCQKSFGQERIRCAA